MSTNIIPILFHGKKHCVAEAAWQFDYGQILSFDDITLDDPFEIHIANVKVKGFASVHIGTDNQFEIPRAYVTSGLPIYGWIYVHPTSTSGKTEYTFVVPVRERTEPDPSAIIPEPEIPVFEQLMGLLQNAVTDAQAAQAAAEQSAQAAAQSQETAASDALEAVRSIEFHINEEEGTLEVTMP